MIEEVAACDVAKGVGDTVRREDNKETTQYVNLPFTTTLGTGPKSITFPLDLSPGMEFCPRR